MEFFYNSKKEKINALTCNDVIELHGILCKNYDLLPEMEPISPTGIKDKNLLESAVSRQLVGSMDYYKYDDLFRNCGTLVFGITKNHAFYNGNKRVAFLALIKHLYVNSMVLRPGLAHNEIYELLRLLADNNLKEHSSEFDYTFHKFFNKKLKWSDEMEIDYLAFWLKKNTVNRNSHARLKAIPIQEMKRILKSKEIDLHQDGNWIYVKRTPNLLQRLFGGATKEKKINIKNQKEVPSKVVEDIRNEFGLSLTDGVDNIAFYSEKEFISMEITAYKKIIYKLAKT